MALGGNAAKLELPVNYTRDHPVFHVSLLRPFKSHESSRPVPVEPIVYDGLPLYQVESFLSHRIRRVGKKRIKQFLIKSNGYDGTHNSWEPLKNLTPDLLAEILSVA